MVRFASPLVILLSCITVGLSTPLRRTVDQINTDIADISAKVTKLDADIEAFPLTGGSIIAALGIHNSAVALIGTLKTATTDVLATGPVTEDDAHGFIAAVEGFEPTIANALVGIVAKKPAFQALPIGGVPALVYQDLQQLKVETTAFADSLISISPETVVEEATTLRDGIVVLFDPAIAAYAP